MKPPEIKILESGEIKRAKISNKDKLHDIEKELSTLNSTVKKYIPNQKNISKYISNTIIRYNEYCNLNKIDFKIYFKIYITCK